jgi:hypothetical protein
VVGGGFSALYDGKYAAYDPVGKLAYGNDGYSFWSYNMATNTYINLQTGVVYDSSGNIIVGGLSSDVDPVRRLLIVFGNGSVSALDLRTNTLNNWSNQTTGCSAIQNIVYPGLTYDSSRGLMVGWAGGNTVYEFNPDTKSCNAVTWPNGPGNPQVQGTNGRFRYIPALNVFALVNDWQQNAYVLRLTNGTPPPPPPPPPASTPCDVNGDGVTNVADVQLEVNMALGINSCTNPSGVCTVVSVQRVVNAALGGPCVSP